MPAVDPKGWADQVTCHEITVTTTHLQTAGIGREDASPRGSLGTCHTQPSLSAQPPLDSAHAACQDSDTASMTDVRGQDF